MDAQGVLPVTFSPTARRAAARPARQACAHPSAARADTPRGAQCKTSALIFELWFLLVLLPVLAVRHPGGCTVIMDNASIHRHAVLRALVIGTGVTLVFLPAYSPELNPVRPRSARRACAVVRSCVMMAAD